MKETQTANSISTLAIFGATGGIGRAALKQALAAGYRVNVLVRGSADRIDTEDRFLTVVVGDVTDEAVVRKTMHGADAVVCCLGAPALSRSKVRSVGTQVITRVMTELGLKRFIGVSLLGARESVGKLPFMLRYFLFPLYLRRPVADHNAQEQIIEEAEIDWTIVRPPFLTDGPKTTNYAHGFQENKGLTLKISRSDVADFMLTELAEPSYRKCAVGISYRR